MLDVDRRIDVDPRSEQFLDVLMALGMAAARRIGMRQLVDQREARRAGDQRIEVHLVQRPPLIGDGEARQNLEPAGQRVRLGAAVRLDHADDDIDALARPRLPSDSISNVLPTPGAAPRKIFRRPRPSCAA